MREAQRAQIWTPWTPTETRQPCRPAAALNLAMAVQEARPAPMAHPQPTPAAAAAFHRSLADIMPASVMLPHFPFSYYATQERLKNCHTSLLAAGAAAAAAAVSSASPSLFTIDSILAPRPLLAHRPPPAYLPFPRPAASTTSSWPVSICV